MKCFAHKRIYINALSQQLLLKQKGVLFFMSLKHFSKRMLFLDNRLKTLVPFLSLENNTENNV